jgi:hypothetical protein
MVGAMTQCDQSDTRSWARRAAISVGLLSVLLEAVVLVRRRGSLFAADTVVRCRRGHYFTTMWIPGASLKSVRLGWWRFQSCPVGHHWDFVTPATVVDLSEDQLLSAHEYHDVRVP